MCHDYPPLTGGGVAGMVRDLAAVLGPGFDVDVITARRVDHFADDRSQVARRGALMTAATAWRLARRADVIVVHWTFSFRWLSCLAVLLGPLTGHPTVCVVHTAPAHLRYNRLRFLPERVRSWLPRLAARASRRCAAIVALSASHAHALTAAGFRPTEVMPAPVANAVAAAGYREVFAARQSSARIATVGYAGEFSELKGTDAVSRLIPALVGEFEVHLAGRGPLLSRVEAATAGRLPAILTDTIDPDRMGVFFSELDVLLAFSRSEAQARLVVEAMLAGVVVLARRAEGLVDLIDPGRTGFFVDPEDDTQTLVRLRQLRDDPGTVTAVRARARSAAEALVHTAERNWPRLLAELVTVEAPGAT